MKYRFQKTIAFKSLLVKPDHIDIIQQTCKNFNAALTVQNAMFNKTEATVLIVNANSANVLAEVFYWIGSTFPYVITTPLTLPTEYHAKDEMINE